MLGQLVYTLTLLEASETAQQVSQSRETLGGSLYISFCYKLPSFLLLDLKSLQQQHTGHLHPSGL